MCCSLVVSGLVLIFVVYLVFLNVVFFFSLGVCLYSGCDGHRAFCLICDACRLRCPWTGSTLCFVLYVLFVCVLHASCCRF